MLRVIHAVLLDLGRDTDTYGKLTAHEEGGGEHSRPANHEKNEDKVCGEHFTTSSVEDTGAPVVTGGVVGVGVLGRGGEEAGDENTPDSTEAVDGDGSDDIVDLELLKDPAAEQVDGGADEASAEGSLGLDCGASSSDGDKAGKDTVVGGTDVNDVVGGHESGKSDGG